jgi:hypothetical protein
VPFHDSRVGSVSSHSQARWSVHSRRGASRPRPHRHCFLGISESQSRTWHYHYRYAVRREVEIEKKTIETDERKRVEV